MIKRPKARIAQLRDIRSYRRFYGLGSWQPAFEWLYRFALAGMNYGDDQSWRNGEEAFLRRLGAADPGGTIIDVGAHTGAYAELVLAHLPGADLHCLEPSPEAFELLVKRLRGRGRAYRMAASSSSGTGSLYGSGSELASLRPRPEAERATTTVRLITLDQFCDLHHLTNIRLLKLDVEGEELAALEGAASLLASGRIETIQFEFDRAAVFAGVHFRDVYELLAPRYRVHRLLRDGLLLLRAYEPAQELYTYSNYIATRCDAES